MQSGALWLAELTLRQAMNRQALNLLQQREREREGTILQTLIHQDCRRTHSHIQTHTHRGHISYIK